MGRSLAAGHAGLGCRRARPIAATVAGATAWTTIDALPTPVMDSGTVTLDGKVYAFGGTDGPNLLFKAFVHDPVTGGWQRLANMPEGLEKPGVDAVGGEIYVVGGWDSTGSASVATYRYDPKNDSWSSVAPLPAGVVAGGTAVLGGRLYVVAGCGGNCNPASQATYVYDPQADAWSRVADYPITDSWLSCAGIDGQVVCAGGTDPLTGAETAATYAFDPVTGAWTQRADLPYPNWAMASAYSGGRLQLVGGVTDGQLTNQAEEYDPATDSWSALPAANAMVYRGGGACGLYVVGGSDGAAEPVTGVEQLPGYGDCGSSGAATWLSAPHTVTVAPGAAVKVQVTFDAGDGRQSRHLYERADDRHRLAVRRSGARRHDEGDRPALTGRHQPSSRTVDQKWPGPSPGHFCHGLRSQRQRAITASDVKALQGWSCSGVESGSLGRDGFDSVVGGGHVALCVGKCPGQCLRAESLGVADGGADGALHGWPDLVRRRGRVRDDQGGPTDGNPGTCTLLQFVGGEVMQQHPQAGTHPRSEGGCGRQQWRHDQAHEKSGGTHSFGALTHQVVGLLCGEIAFEVLADHRGAVEKATITLDGLEVLVGCVARKVAGDQDLDRLIVEDHCRSSSKVVRPYSASACAAWPV